MDGLNPLEWVRGFCCCWAIEVPWFSSEIHPWIVGWWAISLIWLYAQVFFICEPFFFKGAIFQDVQVVIVSDAQFHFPQPIKFITIKPPNLGICFLRRSMEIPWEPRILQSCKMECLAAHLAAAAAVPGRPQLLRWRSRDPLMAMQKCWRKSGTSWYSNTAIYYIYSNHSL